MSEDMNGRGCRKFLRCFYAASGGLESRWKP